MRIACGNIRALVGERSLQDYLDDPPFRWAVERQLTILGEAAYQLQSHFPTAIERVPEGNRIVRFRHVLIHGYEKVEDDLVWGIVQEWLPKLEPALDALLRE